MNLPVGVHTTTRFDPVMATSNFVREVNVSGIVKLIRSLLVQHKQFVGFKARLRSLWATFVAWGVAEGPLGVPGASRGGTWGIPGGSLGSLEAPLGGPRGSMGVPGGYPRGPWGFRGAPWGASGKPKGAF